MDNMFRPPIVCNVGATLNRALFSKTIPIAAARVLDRKNIAKNRGILEKSRDLLRVDRIACVREDPSAQYSSKGGKCLLLKPEVRPDDDSTWSTTLREAVKDEQLGVIPFDLQLNYDYWTYLDIMKSILPIEAQEEIPVGFSIVGHVAHLNLRDQYLPYKQLIAEVLMDKNPIVRTVINKIDNVGNESEYRTFGYELLAGDDDMQVELREEECIFTFDYSKVYWNSRLNTEHQRLVDLFNPGEVVCDLMAGVGPFAIPAGKKGVFVWANDLNPDSYSSMKTAVTRNKVEKYVRPFCEDGRRFIHQAADEILALAAKGENTIKIPKKRSRNAPPTEPIPAPKIITIPQTISHFVMNLPATAIEFLPAFSGIYAGQESLFTPHTETKLPMVHVHCFSTKSDDNVREGIEIANKVSEMLGVEMRSGEGEGEVKSYDVRDVAPLKRMFCASFRLPAEVAFRRRSS